MTTNLIGAVEQLVVLLRRYFTPSGYPPRPAEFSYAVAGHTPGRVDQEEAHAALMHATVIAQEASRFSSLLARPPSPVAVEIMQNILSLSEVITALNDARECLQEYHGPKAERFRYLFDKLCAMEWTNSATIGVTFAEGIATELHICFTLTPIGADFIADMAQAAEEAAASKPPRIVEPDEEERQIIDLLASVGRRMTTDEILSEFSRRGQVKAESTTKSKLSNLVKKSLLTNRQDVRPAGYGLPDW